MDILTTIIYACIGIGGVVGTLIWLDNRLHPYKVRVRHLTGGATRIVYDTLAKIGKDKDKQPVLKLKNKCNMQGKELPLPQEDALDFDRVKKKSVIELYYDQEKGITYIADIEKPTGFDSLPTKHRSMLINQIKIAQERNKDNFAANIPLIVGLAGLIIFTAVVMIFWGQAIEPTHQAASIAQASLDKAQELIAELRSWEQGAQIIAPENAP
jgi:uncharacterized membrane protein YuzA (DUF378 family)